MNQEVDYSTVKDLRPISASLAINFAYISLTHLVRYGNLTSLSDNDRRLLMEAHGQLDLLKAAL